MGPAVLPKQVRTPEVHCCCASSLGVGGPSMVSTAHASVLMLLEVTEPRRGVRARLSWASFFSALRQVVW